MLNLGLEDQAIHEDLFLVFLTPQMEGLRSSEKTVNIYQSTRHLIPKNFNLHQHRCEKLESRILCFNPLKTKRRLLYLKTQFVPRSKHFPSRLQKPINLCCKWHKSLFVLR